MHIYFSGIGGVGIGPLSEIALDAGYRVSGSDSNEGLMTQQLKSRGVPVYIGNDESNIAEVHAKHPINWLVHTAALPEDHPELVFARENGIKISKRDELLAEIIREKNLKLIAVSGTHGKTTTTGMLIWLFTRLGISCSYSIGTTISFGASGVYKPDSKYFLYECDEFDRNMLYFEPNLTIITSLDHDHFDTYPTEEEYKNAFIQFIEQSTLCLLWEKDIRYLENDLRANTESYDELMDLSHIKLAGAHVRQNAFLVERAITREFPDIPNENVIEILNDFPGTARRFEKIAENLYSDYGHHPTEIQSTLQMAGELSEHVVLVYQPHQNSRQHEIKNLYTDEVFEKSDSIYWLPTYLSREDPNLDVLSPEILTKEITDNNKLHFADLDDALWDEIEKHRKAGNLVLCMGAGSIDGWLRGKLS